MNPNYFKKFDQIGLDIFSKMIPMQTSYFNSDNVYGWYDWSGVTLANIAVLAEIKCNAMVQLDFDTTIITKDDFDKILANTPDDVIPLYVIILNKFTFIYNLKKVAESPELFTIKTQVNRNTTMGVDGHYRNEEWVYINRYAAKACGAMKVKHQGGLNLGYDIDELLKNKNG